MLYMLVSVLARTLSDAFKNLNPDDGFCLAQLPSSHTLEVSINPKEPSW